MIIRASRGRLLAAATTLLALVATASPAHADAVQGKGSATITKDVETVRSLARAEARRDLVRAMLRATIGRERIGEVTPEILDELAGQIAPDMITGEQAERQGNQFIVTLSAQIDQAAFRQQLTDAGIGSGSALADGNRALILVYLDRSEGTASDLSRPAEETVDYDRRTGASYSDHSTVTATSREAAVATASRASASTSNSASAQSSQASGAYSQRSAAAIAVRDRRGAAAGQSSERNSGAFSDRNASASSSHAASASSARSASAYSARSSYAERTAVDAEVHDDVSYHRHVVYQQPPRDADGDGIMAALSEGLTPFDVQTANPWPVLSAYFNGRVPRYDDLKRDPRFDPFIRSLAQRSTPFFMGGTFSVTHGGTDPASGQVTCSGTLDAVAFASADGRQIGKAQARAEAMGQSPESCSANLSGRLAQQASATMGKQIQDFWRPRARANAGIAAGTRITYSVTLRGQGLDMAVQGDLMDAITTLPGVENTAFVSQTGTELRVNVVYAGAQPLQFALAGKLRGKPAFAHMQGQADGAAVLLCLGPCQ